MSAHPPVSSIKASRVFQTRNTLKPIVGIKVTGGSFLQQKCDILDGIWRLRLSNTEGVAYIPRASLATLDKVTESGRDVTLKATFKDGRTLVAETTKQNYSALYAEMETGAKPGDVSSIAYGINTGAWGRRFKVAALCILLLVLSPIVGMMLEAASSSMQAVAPYVPPPVPTLQVTTPEEIAAVCKATVSAIMGTDVAIIKTATQDGREVSLKYNRVSDGQSFAYRCKLEGARVLWASDTGRWRNHPMDEVITYSLSTDSVTIRQAYPDGSSDEETFSRSALAQ